MKEGKKKNSNSNDSDSGKENQNKSKDWWLQNQPKNTPYDLQTHWNVSNKNKKSKEKSDSEDESSTKKVSKRKKRSPFDPPKNGLYELMTVCNENKQNKVSKRKKIHKNDNDDDSDDNKPVINKKGLNFLFTESKKSKIIEEESESESDDNEYLQLQHIPKRKSHNSSVRIQKKPKPILFESSESIEKVSRPKIHHSIDLIESKHERKSRNHSIQMEKPPERKIKIDFLESFDSDSSEKKIKKKSKNKILNLKEEICSFYRLSDYRIPNNNIYNNSSKPLNLKIIENVSHPKFNDELFDAEIRLFPNQFDDFFEIVTNHLRTETNDYKLCMKLLIAVDSVLYYDQAFDSIIRSGIVDFLPFTTPKLTILSFKILKLLFMFRPSFFEENYESTMKHLIFILPIELSLSLLIIYAHSFEFIENPWPILDLAIKEKVKLFKQNFNEDDEESEDRNKMKVKKYFHNDPGVEADFIVDDTDESYLSLLFYLNSNFQFYRKNRLKYCRSVFIDSLFDPTISKKASITAYKAVINLFDNEFGEEISISSLFNDLKDQKFEKFSLQILVKMNVDLIPIKNKYIFQLINSAHVDENASLILQKMMSNSLRNEKIASILLKNSKWLKFGLPTFSHTLMIFQSCVKFGNNSLLSEIKNCQEIPFFFKALLNSDNINDIYQISVLIQDIEFDDFKSLSEICFFESLLDFISNINNDDVLPFVNLLSDLATIRYSREFLNFIVALKKLLRNENVKVFHAALKSLANLSAYKKCAAEIKNKKVVKIAEKKCQSKSEIKILKKIKSNLSGD